MVPRVSVVVVSDYCTTKTWRDERALLQRLKEQDITEEVEIVLVENDRYKNQIPQDIYEICPEIKVLFSPENTSAQLKEIGVRASCGELVAVMDADCQPAGNCLRLLVEVLDTHPEVVAVSGRTIYEPNSTLKRCLSLLDRGFIDTGKPGKAYHICNNGALCRREFLEKYPFANVDSPFVASTMRLKQIRQEGHPLYFHPEAVMIHAFDGWGFVMDQRRNVGYADAAVYSELFTKRKNKLLAIIRLILNRLHNEWRDCRRVGSNYLKWYDWPVVIVLLFVVRGIELLGILDFLKGSITPTTAYR